MNRSYIIAGNWKMNTLPHEAIDLARAIMEETKTAGNNVSVILIPPFVHIADIARIAAGSGIAIGAQTCHFAVKGAFTGEISAAMLAAIGCRYCLAGHSERRQYFGETDDIVAKKTAAILEAGMTPIVCVGETLNERQSEMTLQVVERQLNAVLQKIGSAQLSHIVVAYEPVWAIGTGLAATAAQAQEVHRFIREILSRTIGNAAEQIPILYGGSVTNANAAELFTEPDIDGALVGGASLKSDIFGGIIAAA